MTTKLNARRLLVTRTCRTHTVQTTTTTVVNHPVHLDPETGGSFPTVDRPRLFRLYSTSDFGDDDDSRLTLTAMSLSLPFVCPSSFWEERKGRKVRGRSQGQPPLTVGRSSVSSLHPSLRVAVGVFRLIPWKGRGRGNRSVVVKLRKNVLNLKGVVITVEIQRRIVLGSMFIRGWEKSSPLCISGLSETLVEV